MTPKPELEICIETVAAGKAACAGGADRVELCSALSVGGLTPSHGLIAAAVEECGLPVHVLLRPRAGNFVYSDEEYRIILRDLEDARSLGARGVVVGLLDSEGHVETGRMRELVDRAGSMEVTFHRAFDRSRNLSESLEEVVACGCVRILTSGGQPTVGEGIDALAALVRQADGRIRIAAGGGVTMESAKKLLARTPIDLHGSLRHKAAPVQKGADPLWNRTVDLSVDPADVRAMVELLHGATAAQLG